MSRTRAQTPEIVVSRTREKAGWDARVIGKNLAEESRSSNAGRARRS
jgi:hypothetical protein